MDVGNQIIDNLKALLDTLKGTDQPLAEVYDTPNLTSTKYPYCFINDSGIDSDFQDQQLNERMYAFKVWVFNEYDVDNPRTSRRALRSAVDAILNKIDQQESPDSEREIAYGLANLYTVMAVMATLGEAMYDEEQKIIGQLITIRIKVTVDITSALIEGPSGIVDPGHAYIADAADYYTRTETDAIFDSYYTASEVDTLLSGKSNVGHTHDDRYYTESEIGLILANYAPALGADENYVTDAQLAVLANTSGTNTGDNATNSQYSGLDAAKANVTLNNLASVAINTSLLFDTDSAYDIGDATHYVANIFSDKIYLNSTASIDGATAGKISIVGALTTLSNANLSLVPNGTGYTIIGDAGTTSHSFNTNDDLLVSGRLEVDGMAYFDNAVDLTGNLNVTKASPNNVFINTATGQYNSSGFKMYSNASSFGDYAGVNMIVNVADTAASKTTFVIDRINYTGTYKAHLMQIDLNNDIFNIYPTTFGLVGSTAKITTASNANLSLVPNGTGYTIIGNAGTTSHTLNTNDDALICGRLEVNGILYADSTVDTSDVYKVDGTQVVGNRVVDARIDDTPNSGDATTDGIIAAIQSIIQTHGLGAAA